MRCKERARGEKDEGRACSGKLALQSFNDSVFNQGENKEDAERIEAGGFKFQGGVLLVRKSYTQEQH